jgi:2-oxoisovalerate dehydrogenase E2 component (dihydrolipoyl transacylase)
MVDYAFRMPDLGEGTAEAELVEWFVGVGDTVQLDDVIAEVVTEKATIELPSPVAGEVSHLYAAPGDRVAVGAELIRFEVDERDSRSIDPTHTPAAPISWAQAPPEHGGALPPDEPGPPLPPLRPAPAEPSSAATRPLASPAVRLRAKEAGVDLRGVTGTGPGGRIGHDDLDAFRAASAGSRPAAGRPRDPTVIEVPVIGLRRAIAEHMSRAKAHIPHITYVDELNVEEVEALRGALNERFRGERPKLTPLPFLVRAIVRAVADHPEVNARYDDDAGIGRQYGGVHAGIATQTPRGLVVPVIRHAETLDLWETAEEIKRLATAAIDGTADPADLSGSTITVTSLGALGGLVTTPVINYPEVAIIGVNKIQIRPVWDGARFVPRKMMNLSSGFDHRIVDGWNAAVFVQRIKALLEEPAMLFIDGA